MRLPAASVRWVASRWQRAWVACSVCCASDGAGSAVSISTTSMPAFNVGWGAWPNPRNRSTHSWPHDRTAVPRLQALDCLRHSSTWACSCPSEPTHLDNAPDGWLCAGTRSPRRSSRAAGRCRRRQGQTRRQRRGTRETTRACSCRASGHHAAGRWPDLAGQSPSLQVCSRQDLNPCEPAGRVKPYLSVTICSAAL